MNHTLSLLEQHHGDGHIFKELMEKTADYRFNESFWQVWDKWITPRLSEQFKVMDLGCGPATLLSRLKKRHPELHLTGIEYAPYMLENVNTHDYDIIIHDLHEANLAVPDNSVDVITCIYTLHELIQPVIALQEMYRCLKPQAYAIITDWVRVPLVDYLTTQQHDIFCEKIPEELNNIFTHFIEHNRYSRDDMTWLLTQIGFKAVEINDLGGQQFARWVLTKV